MNVKINRSAPNFNIKRRNLMLYPLIVAAGVVGLGFTFFPGTKAVQTESQQVSYFGDIPDPKETNIAGSKSEAIKNTKVEKRKIPSDFDFSSVEEKNKTATDSLDSLTESRRSAAISQSNAIIQSINQENTTTNNNQIKKKYQDEAAQMQKEIDNYYKHKDTEATPPVVIPSAKNTPPKSGFNSLTLDISKPVSVAESKTNSQSISAVILNDVVVKNGETVSIRILENYSVNNIHIHRNAVVTGIAHIRSNRLDITIPGVNVNGDLKNVSFQVYDMDGIKGLRVRGLGTTDAKDEVKDEAINQASNIPGNYGVLGGVVNVIRSISTRNDEQKISIPSGYKVLLKQTN